VSTIVEVERLTKSYGKLRVIDDLSLSLESDKIYGLLGRNGAGKTTIMRLLTAQILATSGSIKVFGEAPYENRRVLSQLCFIKESQRYPEKFCVRDILETAAAFFPQWDRDYAYALSDEFQLPMKRRNKALSRGMLSAAGIVVGLASRAPLTIFDEPYLGMDAVNRNLFYDRLIEDYTEHPRTIIISTHLIDEVSRLLEHIIVIDKGKLILSENAEALREQACIVIGPAENVAAFTSGKNLINSERFGSLTAATVLQQSGAEARTEAARLGLECTSVSLQQLIIYLAKGKAEKTVGGFQ
jgi:ABC-2 type transport system ATP-binding protein